ncbi:MAG: GatB/YqeY domain-containing protein [Desulfuromonadaceae bacterium]|nr:GatB/YqeY domain-containing protein [Desulfuromonadaceae bacterium]
MALKEQLDDAMKAAMKARDNLRLSAVRMVRAAIKNREIDTREELDDQAVTDVISTLVKQRRESIRMYREGNRPELAEKEELELSVLLEFLPAQLSADEIDAIVSRVILDTGASGARDMGRVMKAVSPLTAGKADGKAVSDSVRRLLA